MENASKALLMAGGVLIGILIISLAIYLFADFGATSAEINAQNAQKQLNYFNSKFTAYQGYKDETKDANDGWKITIYDILSLIEYAKENNEYYEGVEENQIAVCINNKNFCNQSDDYKNLIEKYTTNGKTTKFSCGENAITYNSNGRVTSINFKPST